MSGDRSGSVDLKTVGAIVGTVVVVAGVIGSWYVNSYRIDKLEEQDVKVMEAIRDTKCFVADVHEVPLPECR